MNNDFLELIIKDLQPLPDCDADFARALIIFKSELTISHNVTTRNLWNLVRQHLDAPLQAVICLERGEMAQQLLLDLKLSIIGHTKPKYCFNADQWAAQKKVDPSRAITPDLVYLAKYEAKLGKSTDIDVITIFYNMELWYQNIRFAIHCSMNDSLKNSKAHVIQTTLDTVINLIKVLNAFKPDKVLYKTENKNLGLQSYNKTHRNDTQYCELCWRLTMKSMDYVIATETQTEHQFRLNDQYCEYHDPDPTNLVSQYKTDLPYREVFQYELGAKLKREPSKFSFHFPLDDFSSGYEKDARKAIYDLVHAKLRPMRGKNKMTIGLKEQVFMLKTHQKLDFDEIATELKTSKHSVKRAWRELEHLFELRQYERYVSDYTGEVIDALLTNEACRLIKHVNDLSISNTPLRKIAKQTQLFTYTVRAIQIRIKLINEGILKLDELKTQFQRYKNTESIIAQLEETKNCLHDNYLTGTKLMFVKKVEKDWEELKNSRKKLGDLFISKFIQSVN
jgi:hypothetical protein